MSPTAFWYNQLTSQNLNLESRTDFTVSEVAVFLREGATWPDELLGRLCSVPWKGKEKGESLGLAMTINYLKEYSFWDFFSLAWLDQMKARKWTNGTSGTSVPRQPGHLRDNWGHANYAMASTLLWKPFSLANQLYAKKSDWVAFLRQLLCLRISPVAHTFWMLAMKHNYTHVHFIRKIPTFFFSKKKKKGSTKEKPNNCSCWAVL